MAIDYARYFVKLIVQVLQMKDNFLVTSQKWKMTSPSNFVYQGSLMTKGLGSWSA